MRHLFLFIILLHTGIVNSQIQKYTSQYFILNISQLKESMNFGFVFSGPQLEYGRNWKWQKTNRIYELHNHLGVALLSNKGPGYDFHITPFNFNILFRFYDHLWLGPSILTDYNYEFYPDLQTGHDFWFSHYSAGASLFYKKVFQKRLLNIKFSSSLFGFTSRTQENFNPHYFDLGVKTAVTDLHQNMKLLSLNQYLVFHLEIGLNVLKNNRLYLSYLIDYTGYYKEPEWSKLNYGIKFTIKSKKSSCILQST